MNNSIGQSGTSPNLRVHHSQVVERNVAALKTFSEGIRFDEMAMQRFELLEFERRPLALRQSHHIGITCLLLKGSERDGIGNIDGIEMGVERLKTAQIGIEEWLES